MELSRLNELDGFAQLADVGVDALRDLQLRRLRWSLRHAYDNVGHYRARFEAAGVHPDDLGSLDDLARFPLTSKEDLRQNYPFGMFAVPREQVARVHASSGTTGKPTVVGYTAADVETWAAVMARSIYVAGGRPGDIVHVAYGYGLFTGGLGAHYGAEKLGCTVVPVSGGMTARQVQLITDFKPRIIMVTPSYFLSILDEMTNQGIEAAGSSLQLGIFGAEPWTEAMRAEMQARAGLTAVDIYGLSEVMGPGIGQEVAGHPGRLQLWEDHFYPEIIDPRTGEVVAAGERGELVLTSLTKHAMPVVRYRTRDLTRLLPGSAYPAFRSIEKITGRTDDMMIIRGVNVFPTQIEELLLSVPGLAPHFECVLIRPDRLDELSVRVESREAAADAPALAAQLGQLIKDRIGVSVAVEVVAPETIPRSQGKAVRVHDRR
jgi:phenylacetate-CoA ligase